MSYSQLLNPNPSLEVRLKFLSSILLAIAIASCSLIDKDSDKSSKTSYAPVTETANSKNDAKSENAEQKSETVEDKLPNPNIVKDLIVWLESSSTNSFDAKKDGDKISVWKNQAAEYIGNDFIQEKVNNQPILKSKSVNQLPGVDFSVAKEDYLKNSNLGSKLKGKYITVFWVENHSNVASVLTSGAHEQFLSTNPDTDEGADVGGQESFSMGIWRDNGFMVALRGEKERIRMGYKGGDLTKNLRSFRSSFLGKEFFENGDLLISNPNNEKYTLNDSELIIGHYWNKGEYNGILSELLIFNRDLSDEEMDIIHNYLKLKYKL